jgi:DnaJ-class molecular chaperone
MPNVHTHYDNLKVARNAPIEVIEAAYRSLAQKYHPERDPSPHAARIMTLISHAYSVLATPKLRREHDEWIRQAEAANNADTATEAGPELTSKRALRGSRQIFIALLMGLAIGVGIWRFLPSTQTVASAAPSPWESSPFCA